MARRGTVIAFSGAIAAGTSELSRRLADRLSWPWVRFSDYIREYAREHGEDSADTSVLQRLGQDLVQNQLELFVRSTLARATPDWRKEGNLVIDGLRHVEVHLELRKQIGLRAQLRVVHVSMDLQQRRSRARANGIEQLEFDLYERDITEAQIERVLPSYAELHIKGSDSLDKMMEQIIRGLAPPEAGGITAVDRNDPVSQMEPLTISEDSRHRTKLADLAFELVGRSKDLSAEIPKGVRRPLADIVRSMNCYYSNLIEGHNTHPIDIERALRDDFSENVDKRNLQLEARAHIATQQWLDDGGLAGASPLSGPAVREIHRRFCDALPNDLLWVSDPETEVQWHVVPGEYRQHDVKVGRHIPPSPGAVHRFIRRFEDAYAKLGNVDQILAAATGHHRLLWIHPFLDGNGRVARLMSHSVICNALQTHAVWSVARGLARQQSAYKGHLMACDLTRRNDLDGRGNLSEEALAAFTEFFLRVCLDQIDFMRGLIQPDRIQARIKLWAQEEAEIKKLPPQVYRMLSALIGDENLSQSEAEELMNIGTAGAQAISTLEAYGVVVRDRKTGSLRLEFPARLAERFLPGLFPSAP